MTIDMLVVVFLFSEAENNNNYINRGNNNNYYINMGHQSAT